MRAPGGLGLSVQLSIFEDQKQKFENPPNGTLLFISLVIGEDSPEEHGRRVTEACSWLNGQGYRILAEIDTRTLDRFGQADLLELVQKLDLWSLLVNADLCDEDIAQFACQFRLAVKAAETDPALCRKIIAGGGQLIAVHNCYPRPETGLDDEQFISVTQALHEQGIPVYAFIPGNGRLSGPLFEGLPTLEKHRKWKPLAALADLFANLNADAVIVGDGLPQKREWAWMFQYASEGILPVPAQLNKGYSQLYHQVFTCRPDSPAAAIRLLEAEDCPYFSDNIPADNCAPRKRGHITLDNHLYGPYAGEVQILRKDWDADDKVNVIGQVAPEYLPLVDAIRGGQSFVLVPPE